MNVRTCRPRYPGGNDRGFTLIELLVVVSIIALLISILLPSLRRAREQTKDVVCKANLHSIGQAFTMYGEKFNGVWPPAVDTFGLQNRWPVPFFEGKIVKDEYARYSASGAVLRGGGPTVFLCPAEKADRRIANWRGTGAFVDRVVVGGSYALSEEIHRRNGKLERGYFPPPTAVPPFVNKVDNCRRAGSVVALMDNAWPLQSVTSPGWRVHRGANGEGASAVAQLDGSFYQGYRSTDGTPVTDQASQYYRNIGGRHLGKGNGLMIDTHVEGFRPEKLKYDQVSWTPWTGDPAKIPGGQ
jgi:prepilin-type N-terminal cleavage/methylation domain-containing protein/prepilin-type processing-associated H-X9-DG protein